MKCYKDDLLLYAVTDRAWLGKETLRSQVEMALKGGVTFVQLREKELETVKFFEEAKELKGICEKYHVPFVINDNVDIAIAVDADGVHVGQRDMEAGNVRELIGKDKILGVSAQTVEQALLAEREGADYLGVGAVFHTGSKADADDVSYETLKAICQAVSIPVIAIGGINRDNIMELSGSGICGIAVISAVFAQPDIAKASAELRELTEKVVKKTTGAIFDLDGTILDSMMIWDNAGEMFLNSIGIKAESGLGKIMFSMSMTKGAGFLKDRYDLGLTVEEIVAGINCTIEDFYYNQVQLKDGAEQLLRNMKQAGIKMTAATSSDRQIVVGALKRLRVLNCFEKIFTCTEIGAGKEKPDIYLAAAEYMGILPKDTWVFEDALHAIRTAKSAGFRTVGIYDASSLENWEEMKVISDISFEKLELMPGKL